MRTLSLICVLVAVMAGGFFLPAEGRLTHIEIERIEYPAFGDISFGKAGRYEKIVGRYHGELDPGDRRNGMIADLDGAPRNNRGRVEYSADLYILKPVDMRAGNGALFYEFGNRGHKNALAAYNSAVTGGNNPLTADDAGSGFLMRRGYALVWSGHLGDVRKGSHRLTIQLPVVTGADGSTIEGTVWDECNFFGDSVTRCPLSYPVPRIDQSEALLLVRERRSDVPVEIPRAGWAFDGPGSIKLLPEGTPFQAGFIYHVVHRAANPPVMGIGLAAVRDLISFLRHEEADDAGNANPLRGVTLCLAFGASQTGRVMREFLYLGFNEDENVQGRRIFDGMDIHVAATRPFVNYRFAQPTRAADLQHEDLFYPTPAFPFAYEEQTDSITGKRDGILVRCSRTGTCPKIMHTVTSTEYWQFKNSAVTTDTLGRRDGFVPDDVRIYFFTGAQHNPYAALVPAGVCEQQPNILDYRPILRALLAALHDWVRTGRPPPESRYPRIADGTLVPPEKVAWPAIPNATFAGPVVNRHRIYDYGPLFDRGIITTVPPLTTHLEYAVLVPQVDGDGNEIAGIRLPAVSAPTGTRTGWALRARSGAAGELCNQDGSYIPFALTKEERMATGDPRPSIEERYPGAGAYPDAVARAVDRLRRERFILEEDAGRLLEPATVGATATKAIHP